MNNTYQKKQLILVTKIEQDFKSGNVPSEIVTPIKNYDEDNRLCLAGVSFLPSKFCRLIISKLINPLKKADNGQYFYNPRSLHMTINSVRTINDPPLFTENDIQKANQVFAKVVPKHKKFFVEVKRLFELPTSLAITAFTGQNFEKLVFELRSELASAGVPDTKRYASQSMAFGNITIARFIRTPNSKFLNLVQKLKDTNLGKLEISKVSLVVTNAVSSPKKTRVISDYNLS